MQVASVYNLFKGKLVGESRMKKLVCQAVVLLPDELIHQITQTCWFVSSFKDAWGFTFTGNDLKNQHLIFLSDDLFNQNTEQIMFSILHEIGHVVLMHRNSVFINQTQSEIRRQELEADSFAQTYLR